MMENDKGEIKMTNFEEFLKRMRDAGANETQVKSKTALLAYSVLGEMSEDANRLWDLKSDIAKAEKSLDYYKRAAEDHKKRIDKETKELIELQQKINAYIDHFNQCLEAMETETGRDRLKAAQIFINTVNVDTKYDNTAFIVGLSALLSGVTIDAPEELKKINKRFGGRISLGRI